MVMLRTLVALILLLGPVASAQAQDLSGLFSSEGIEVRADQRVYTLFALFNALGYDRELRRGPAPLEAPVYSDVRRQLRAELSLKQKELDTAAAASFLEAHQKPVLSYVDQVLWLETAPGFKTPSGSKGEELQPIAELLHEFHGGGAGELYEQQRELLRQHAKAWVSEIDTATAKGRAFARVPDELPEEDDPLDEDDAPRIVVIVNPLDSHGAAYTVEHGNLRYLIMGPPSADSKDAADPVLVAALAEMLEPYLRPALKKIGRDAVRKALAGRGVKLSKEQSPYDAAIRGLAASFAKAALKRPLSWPKGIQPADGHGFSKAADSAVAWYAKRKEPLPKLSGQLVAKTLGTKAP